MNIQNLKTKLGLWLLKGSHKFPTIDELVTVTQDGNGIILGDRYVEKMSITQFGRELQSLKDNPALEVIINTILFKWQSNIVILGGEKDVNLIRTVGILFEDFESVLNQVSTAYDKVALKIDKDKKNEEVDNS